jgi:hypothetical protein
MGAMKMPMARKLAATKNSARKAWTAQTQLYAAIAASGVTPSKSRAKSRPGGEYAASGHVSIVKRSPCMTNGVAAIERSSSRRK